MAENSGGLSVVWRVARLGNKQVVRLEFLMAEYSAADLDGGWVARMAGTLVDLGFEYRNNGCQ